MGLAVVSVAAVRATTLVAVWSPNELLLAADSAVTLTGAGIAGRARACKIGQESADGTQDGSPNGGAPGAEASRPK